MRLNHGRTDSSKSSISGYAPPIKPEDATATDDSVRTPRLAKPTDAGVLKVGATAPGRAPLALPRGAALHMPSPRGSPPCPPPSRRRRPLPRPRRRR